MAPRTNRYKKSRKTHVKRKTIFKKNKNYNANNRKITYFASSQMPFAPRYRTKLTLAFYGNIAIGFTNNTAGLYTVRLNSVFQPAASGNWPNALPAIATLAPAGYSSLANTNLYRTVRVYGSKIEMYCVPETSTDVIEVCITPSTVATAPASTAAAMEQFYTKQKLFNAGKNLGNSKDVLKSYMTQHKFLGCRAGAIEDDLSGTFVHAYNGNPGVPMYWVVNAAMTDGVASTGTIDYTIKMTYWIEMYNSTGAIALET